MPPALEPVLKFKAVDVTVDLDVGMKLETLLHFASEEEAREADEGITQLQGEDYQVLVSWFLQETRLGEATDALKDLTKNLKHRVQGKDLHIDGQLKMEHGFALLQLVRQILYAKIMSGPAAVAGPAAQQQAPRIEKPPQNQ
jgi:hypothetical protein